MIDKTTVLKKNDEIASRVIEGEAVVIKPSTGEILVLNEVGSRVWDMIDGELDVEALSRNIQLEFDVDYERARRDVIEFCEGILKKELVSNSAND